MASFDIGNKSDDANFEPLDVGPSTRLGVGGNINISEVSGSATSGQITQGIEQIEEFAAEGGGLLAICFGLHIIAGHLIAHSYTLGTPNVSKIIVALGAGQETGLRGEWHAAVKVWYAGQELSVSPDATTAGYRFHNGQRSTSITDPNQPVDAFLSGGIAYNTTAYIAVKLPDAYANAEDRPDKLRGLYQTRHTHDYDNKGNAINYGYFAAPATAAADRVRAYYERRYRADLNVAFDKFQKKISWPDWRAWNDFNGAGISWDDGTTTRTIARFEGHYAITDEGNLADILDLICSAACATWQDNGEQIVFLPPTDRDPVHHFNESNIIDAPQAEPRDLRNQANLFEAKFRDTDDPFLGLTSVAVKRQDLINQMGEIKSVQSLPNMNQSQARRILEYRARLECDNPWICTLRGDESSIHVARGDFVTVTHSALGWEYQRCLVLAVVNQTAEGSPDTNEFILQRINGSLYGDNAGPRQEALAA